MLLSGKIAVGQEKTMLGKFFYPEKTCLANYPGTIQQPQFEKAKANGCISFGVFQKN
jgi:hypothetical protein